MVFNFHIDLPKPPFKFGDIGRVPDSPESRLGPPNNPQRNKRDQGQI